MYMSIRIHIYNHYIFLSHEKMKRGRPEILIVIKKMNNLVLKFELIHEIKLEDNVNLIIFVIINIENE